MQNESAPDLPLSIAQAAQVCPKVRGRRLHTSTLWRWMRRGCKARNGETVRLAHRRVGGMLTTTRADLDRFFQNLADADLESFKKLDDDDVAGPRKLTAPPKQFDEGARRAQRDRAQRILNDAGI